MPRINIRWTESALKHFHRRCRGTSSYACGFSVKKSHAGRIPALYSNGENALRDVTRLHSFLAGRNAAAAKRAVATIRAGVGILADHPEIGRPIDDMSSEFREWLVEFGQGAYVLLYRYDGSQIVILAVRHGREAGY